MFDLEAGATRATFCQLTGSVELNYANVHAGQLVGPTRQPDKSTLTITVSFYEPVRVNRLLADVCMSANKSAQQKILSADTKNVI